MTEEAGMTAEQNVILITEIRTDFQLPPYFPDDTIQRSIRFAENRLLTLNEEADFESDLTARMLLKNYAYYDLFHKTEEFEKNWKQTIMSWQLQAEGDYESE